jgi:hypothetical protein
VIRSAEGLLVAPHAVAAIAYNLAAASFANVAWRAQWVDAANQW